MSERMPSEPEPESDPDEPAASAKPPGVTPLPARKRWKVWAKRVAIGLVVVVLALRLAVALGLSMAVAQVGQALGLHAELSDHRLSVFWGELELRGLNVSIAGEATPVLELDRVVVDVSLSSLLGGDLVVESVDLDGVALTLERDAQGELPVLRAIETALGPAPAPAAEPVSDEGDPLELPVEVRVDRVAVKNVHVTVIDRVCSPVFERTVAISEAEVSEWELSHPYAPTSASLSLGIEGLLDSLRVGVQTQDAAGAPWVTVDVSATGARLGALAGYLQPLGVHAVHETLDVSLAVRLPVEGLVPTHVEVGELELSAQGDPEFALQRLSISCDVLAKPLRVEAVELSGIVAKLVHGADGVVSTGGLAFDPAALSEPAPRIGADAPPGPISAPPAEPGDPFALILDRLRVELATLHVEDHGLTPPVKLSLELKHAELTDFELDLAGATPRPGRFDVLFGVPTVVDSVAVVGSFMPALAQPQLGVACTVAGLTAQGLEPYLSLAGIAPIYTAAGATFKLDAAASLEDPDAWDARCTLREVALTDGERTWAGLERLELVGAGVSPVGSHLGSLSCMLRGASAEVEQRASGAWSAGGLSLVSLETLQALFESEPDPNPPTPLNARELRDAIPALTLEQLDVGVARFTVIAPHLRHELRPLRVRTLRPWALPADPRAAAPLELECALSLPGLLDELTLGTVLSPFADQPHAKVALEGHGLKGPAVAALSSHAFRAEAIRDGDLGGVLEVKASSSLLAAELPTFSVVLRDVALEGSPTGPHLFALERCSVSGVAISSSRVAVKAIEVVAPELSVRHAQARLEACGVEIEVPRLNLGSAATTADDAAADGEGPVIVQVESLPEPEEGAPPSSFRDVLPEIDLGVELELGSLDVTDVSINFEDHNFTPPVYAPLEGGELHARKLRWPPAAEHPASEVTFRLASGVLSDGSTVALESLTGTLKLHLSDMVGVLEVELQGLDMKNLQGAGQVGGVQLHEGNASVTVTARLQPEQLSVETLLTLNQLRLSEPPGSALRELLDLPVGLDSAVFLLRDEAGVIEVPVGLDLPSDGLTLSRIVLAGVKALGAIVGRSVLRSPLRGLSSLQGLGGGMLELVDLGDEVPSEPFALPFLPGGVALSSEGEAQLTTLIEQARAGEVTAAVLIHHEGAADAELCRRVFAPSKADLSQALARLDERLDEFEQGIAASRASLAAIDSADQPGEDGEEVEGQRAALRELEAARQALIENQDELCTQLAELSNARSQRSAARRLRKGVLRLGSNRLEALSKRLLRIPGLKLRVQRPVHNPEPPEGPGYVGIVTQGSK